MLVIKEGDSGSYVDSVQLALERAGFSPGKIDGVFGGRTKASVIRFQQSRGLTPDGIVGRMTANQLRPYLAGYTTYTVRPGDTLDQIARNLHSTVPLIENANPDIEASDLRVGDRLNVPFDFPLVPTNVSYHSMLCELICEGLSVRYPFITLSVAGRSVQNRPIPMLKMGRGAKKVFFNAAHHANEWITTPLVLKFVEDYATGVTNATQLGGQNSEYMFDSATLYIIPMVNPDGVDLVTGAIQKDSEAYMDVLAMANNYPSIPFPSGWKANIKGVDLNLNYPAMWERAKELKYAAGFTKPGPRDFVGAFPLSEPESRAIFEISGAIGFDITVSFHTQGEEIYWKFENYIPKGGRELGERMARASGYRLAETARFSSYAGYKDWFIMIYLLPGYTVEAGRGQNPLPIALFGSIYPHVLAIMAEALAFEEPTNPPLHTPPENAT